MQQGPLVLKTSRMERVLQGILRMFLVHPVYAQVPVPKATFQPKTVFMQPTFWDENQFFLSECHTVVTVAHIILDKGCIGCFIHKIDSSVVKFAS